MPRTPQRTCVGCRRVAGPDALVRLARRPDGSITVGRRVPGRGAWLCAGSVQCFEAAVRRRALSRALKAEVPAAQVAVLRGTLFGDVKDERPGLGHGPQPLEEPESRGPGGKENAE